MHNCSMRLRQHFKRLIALFKAGTVKNKNKHNDFKKLGFPRGSTVD